MRLKIYQEKCIIRGASYVIVEVVYGLFFLSVILTYLRIK